MSVPVAPFIACALSKEEQKKNDTKMKEYLKSRDALQAELEKHGYTLYKVSHFKNFDRIHFGNDKIKINLKLRGKLSEIALDVLIKACIGSEKND